MAFTKATGGGAGGDTESSIPINQTAHGFTVPQAVYLDDGDGLYKLAKADALATANAIGIVSAVQDANNFTLVTAGAQNIFTGLTEGKTFYVSESTAGALTDTRPNISRPILNAVSATSGVIFIDAVTETPSTVDTIYNSDGTTTDAVRTVTVDSGSVLLIEGIDTESINNATIAGFLHVQDEQVLLRHSKLDGAGLVTGFQEFQIDFSLGMLITDTEDEKGVAYAADYSANFTARSLVDKDYVDTEVSTAPSIFNTNGEVTATRVVNAPQGRMISFNAFDVDNFGNSNEEGFLQVISNRVAVGYIALDGAGGIDGISQVVITATGMIVTDSINDKGLEYAADYSASFTDRSLVDKGYTDQGFLSRSVSGAADLTSSGKPILAVTDSSADRTVTIATADIEEGRQFIVKDEGGQAGTNMVTVTTPTISVTSVASGTSGSDFLTSTVHGYAIGQVVIHAGFSDGTYNGKFTVTDIVSTTRYEVAAITFAATDTGTSNIAIDGQANFTIGVDYGSLEFYCTDNQVFTKGAGNVALAARSSTTGLLEGGDMSIVSPPSTTLNISAAEGQIVDQTTPSNPAITPVSIAADPTYSIVNSVDGVYIVAIDVNSNVVEIDLATLTTEERHSFVMIGGYVLSSGNAVRILNEPINVGYGISTGLSDFASDIIGPANQQGNIISANGANLSIDTTSGVTFIVGQNFRNDPDKPHQRTLPAVSVLSFRRSFIGASGELLLESGGATFTVLDPDQYNVTPGSLSATPNNNWTAQVLFAAPAGIYNVAFGQEAFSTSAAAVTAIQNGTITFVEIEAFLDQVMITYIVVQQGATDLSAATFIPASKFRMDTPA